MGCIMRKNNAHITYWWLEKQWEAASNLINVCDLRSEKKKVKPQIKWKIKERRIHHEVLTLFNSRSTNYFGKAAKCICRGLSCYMFLLDKAQKRRSCHIHTVPYITRGRYNLSSFIVFPVLGQSTVVFSVIVQFIFRNDNYCANYHHEKKEIEIVTGVQWQCSHLKSWPKNNKLNFVKIIIKIHKKIFIFLFILI